MADEAVNNVTIELTTDMNLSVAEIELDNVTSEGDSDEMNLSVAVQKDCEIVEVVARLSVAELSVVTGAEKEPENRRVEGLGTE